MRERLGKYRVERKLASGGMGAVFLGAAPDGRSVVLKVPHAQDRNAAVALADEARTGARLRHPSIVETLDFFVEDNTSVLVVSYIEGKTLFERRRHGPLPPSAIAALGEQLASAMEAIHSAIDENGRPLDVLHRDISPNNIIVDAQGQARLIDLGIARSADRKQKSTQLGMVKGTLRYLAPEVLAGGDHSRASDLWALGVTLWEAALARYAVPGDTMLTMRAALDGSMTQLHSGERVDEAVVAAIEALVAPAEMRLQNARAAAAVFSRLSARFPDGRDALGAAVRLSLAQRSEPAWNPFMSEGQPADATETLARPVALGDVPEPLEVASVLEPPDGPRVGVGPRDESVSDAAAADRAQVDSVFTNTVPRSAIRAAAVPPSHAASGPTLQMPAWEQPPCTTLPQAPSIGATAPVRQTVDPQGPTLLSMPAFVPPSAKAAPTVQLPAFQRAPHEKKRSESLFIQVVVVDEFVDSDSRDSGGKQGNRGEDDEDG